MGRGGMLCLIKRINNSSSGSNAVSPFISPTVVLFPGNTTFGKLRLFGLVISSLSYYVGLQGTIYQAMQNIEGGYYFDILAITSLSQGHIVCTYPKNIIHTLDLAIAANSGLSLILL